MDDITKTGPVGLTGLKGVDTLSTPSTNKYSELINQANTFSQAIKSSKASKAFLPIEDIEGIGNLIQGTSLYDDKIQTMSDVENINNFRGMAQPGIDQLANGIAKMGILAATTFANSFIVPTLGFGTGIKNAIEGKGMSGFTEGFWNNGGTKVLDSLNQKSEEALKNYYTDYELEAPWYDNVFTANFIGDKMLKNMGFTIGSIGAAMVTGGLVNPLASTLGKAGLYGARALTTAISTMGEASVEATNASLDYFKGQQINIDSYYNDAELKLQLKYGQLAQLIESEPDLIYTLGSDGKSFISKRELKRQQLASLYDQEYKDLQSLKDLAIAKATDDRIKVGNFTFLANNALLGVTNNIQFARELTGGFTNAARGKTLALLSKTTGNELIDSASKITALKSGDAILKAADGFGKTVAKKALLNTASESFEEGALNVIAATPRIKFAADMNSFMGAKINPDSLKETDNYLNAAALAILENFGSPDSKGWEEAFLGGISGLLGVPMFKKGGRYGIKPTWAGGAKEAYLETKDEYKSNNYVEALNSVILNPNFVSRYEALIRRNTYQAGMDKAIEEGDKFDYKNYEHSQFVSDAIMFKNIGLIDTFNEYLDSFSDVSDADIKELKEDTTIKDSNGKSIYENKSAEEIKESIKTRAKENKELFKNILYTYDNLLINYGDKYNQEGIEELTWLTSTASNLIKRNKDLIDNYLKNTNKIVTDNNIQSDKTYKIKDSEDTFTLQQALSNPIDFVNALKNNTFKNDLNEVMLKADNTDELLSMKNDLLDIHRIQALTKNVIDRRNLALKDPYSLAKTTALIKQEVIDRNTIEVLNDVNNKIQSADDNISFRNYVSEILDENLKSNLIKLLQASDNTKLKILATNYVESNQIKADISKVLKSNSIQLKPEELEIASILFDTAIVDLESKELFKLRYTENKEALLASNKDATELELKKLGKTIDKVINKVLNTKSKIDQSRSSSKPDPNSKGKTSVFDKFEASGAVDASEIDFSSLGSKKTKSTKISNEKTVDLLNVTTTNTTQVPVTKKGFSLLLNAKISLEDIDFNSDEIEMSKQKPITIDAKKVINKLPILLEEAHPELIELLNTPDVVKLVEHWVGSKRSLESFIKKSDDESMVKIAKYVYNIIHPEVSENSVNSTNIPELINSSKGNFRSYVETKYDIDSLKDKNLRRAVKRSSPVVLALDDLGAYDFVDNGYLGILFNRNNDNYKNSKDPEDRLKVHYIMSPSNSVLENNILLAIEILPYMKFDIPEKAFTPIVINNKLYLVIGTLGYNNGDTITTTAYESILDKLKLDRSNILEDEYYLSPDNYSYINLIYSGRFVKSIENEPVSYKPLGNITTTIPKLGVYYDNAIGLIVPGLSENELIVPLNTNNNKPRSGSLFVMSRGADGKWYAKSLEVLRFTDLDYKLEDNLDTPLMKNLTQSVLKLIDSKQSTTDRAKAKLEISDILYFPEDSYQIHFNKDIITISDKSNVLHTIKIDTTQSLEDQAFLFMKTLQDPNLNLRFQVSRADLIHDYYVKDLIDSNILYTDLAQLNNVNASFSLYLNNKVDTPVGIKEIKLDPVELEFRPAVDLSTKSFIFYNSTYIIDKEGNIFRDNEPIEKDPLIEYIKNIYEYNQLPDAIIGKNSFYSTTNNLGTKILIYRPKDTNIFKIPSIVLEKEFDEFINKKLVDEAIDNINRYTNIKPNDILNLEQELTSNNINTSISNDLLNESTKNTTVSITDSFDADAINKVNLLLDSNNSTTFDEIILDDDNFDRTMSIMEELDMEDIDQFKDYLKSKNLLVNGSMTSEDYNTLLDNLKECR